MYFCTAQLLLFTAFLHVKFEPYTASAIREIFTGVLKFNM